MTSALSLILAFMLTLGGTPAVSVSPVSHGSPGSPGGTIRPVNSIGSESGVSTNITEKPRLGEFLKIYPVGTIPNAQNPRLLLNLKFHYEKSPLMNLYQGFNMNPYNFTDPWGLSLKLSGAEMMQFELNLTDRLIELYDEYYDPETAAMLEQWARFHAKLENKVWAFNELTGLNLEVPDQLTIFDKIFGTAKSYANFSKKMGSKVRQFLGADEAQERIDSAEDHWLVKDDVTLPGHITITQQINIAFAEGAADIAEFSTEELQWAIVAGVSRKALQKAGKLRKGNKIKTINLPSWKKVEIDIEHILSGHAKGGLRIGSRKDIFPEYMTKDQIERYVRQAYRYGKKIKRQGNKVKVVGEYGGITIHMWVDTKNKLIETAYPKF